jgi:hypothetical protein
MTNKLKIAIVIATFSLLSCKSQQNSSINSLLPKIENYTKGELEIWVTPFGADSPNEIKVGHISADGSIHFKWPKINIEDYKASWFFMHSLDFLLGMYNCNEEIITEKNEVIKAADTKFLFLYNKYGDFVGSLHPATHKEIENSHDFLTIGSYFTWFYSNGDGKLNAVCTKYNRIKDSDEFDKNSIYNTKIYNINFIKGWNLVEHKVLEVKDQKWNDQLRSMRYKEEKLSINKMPSTANWYLNYTANDESLRIERELAIQKPITKEQYKNWAPKKLGKLKRTTYEVGKKLKRMPTLNNIELLFEKGSKKATVTVVDCAGSKDAASMYTLILDMLSRDWKDTTKTGYNSASKMDDKRVMIEYNEKEVKSILTYYANDRFLIKAEAINIKPDELWKTLKKLQIEKLNN